MTTMPPRLPSSWVPDLIAAGLLLAGALWPGAPRAVQVAVLAGLLTALGRAGWAAAGALLPDGGRASRAACAFCVGVALATTTATLLGHCGWLRPVPFLLGGAAAALAVRWAARGRPAAEREAAAAEAPAPPPPPRLVALERLLLAAALLGLAVVTLRAVRAERYAFPGTFGFDDPSYHLSAVATWHRYGDLRMLKFDAGDPSTAFYPIGSELVAWALLAPFRDSDVAARWAQLPFLPAALVAVAALGRTLGLSRRSALLAAALFGALPRIVPLFTLSAGNDLSTAFFAVAAADALLLLGRRPAAGRAVYAGLAAGLLVGTKYIGLLFCGPLLLVLAASAAAHRREWSARRGLGVLALAAGVALAAGGYTYARNAQSTGNPVFPAPVAVAGHTLLPGWEAVTIAERRKLPEFAIDVPRFLTRRPDLFGALFPWTLLPAALLAPAAALLLPRRRPFAQRLETAAVFALPLLFFLQFRFQMHDHRDLRYVLAGVAGAGVACAWLLERCGPLAGGILRAVLAGLLLAEALHRLELGDARRALAAAALIGGAALVLAAARRRPGRRRISPALAWGAAAAFVALAAAPLGATAARYQSEGRRRPPPPHLVEARAAEALESDAPPAGAEVAYVGGNRPYLFFGRGLQNGVHVVPTESDLAGRFFTWGGHARWPYSGTRYWRWRANLERLGVDYVVVAFSDQVLPERRWLRRHPELFRRIYEDGWVEIWKVTDAVATPPGALGTAARP